MRPHRLILVVLFASLIVPGGVSLAAAGAAPVPTQPADFLLREEGIAEPAAEPLAKSPSDTLDLYGGPGTLQGEFEDAGGQPDWQGWTSVDRTDLEGFWQVSTFRAENLNGHGAGNHAMWCGRDVTQVTGWATAPGYGNNWLQSLIWTSGPLADPDSAQVVELDFWFNHDTEPGYDFFLVEYDSSGTWVRVLSRDGRSSPGSGTFSGPGLHFTDLTPGAIAYAGGDYGGPGGNEIVLRLRFISDGLYSDEDGNWDTEGAAQVDDITVRWRDSGADHVSFEDFESTGPYAWSNAVTPYAGDFAKLFVGLANLDECTSNLSSVVNFIDDGTPPSNPRNSPPQSTGGSLPSFENWDPPSYGLPGGWVTNYTGGLSGGPVALLNEVWSPPIAWDLPGPEDDGPEWAGVLLEYDAMLHLPLLSGQFHRWFVRSSVDGGSDWAPWTSDGFSQTASDTRWMRAQRDLTTLIAPGATHVQIALGIQDLAGVLSFFAPGNDATPAPWFDNVRLRKIRLHGPKITLRDIDQFQDSFPQSGKIDASNLVARDALDVRIDAGLSLNGGIGTVTAGDSLVVEVASLIDQSSVMSAQLVWVLEENPLFEESLRANRPASAVALPTPAGDGWARWMGEVEGSHPTQGPVVHDSKWFFDLPDQDFFYPGDRLRYFVRASDDQLRVSIAPEDTSGFASGEGYDERFRVRALPTLLAADGEQRKILIVDDSGKEARTTSLRTEFAQIADRNHFYPAGGADAYVVRGASSSRTNGIGSAGVHGANLAQLAGYDRILYTTGRRSGAPSDGSGTPGNDRGNDLQLLTQWHSLPGNRGMAHLGTRLTSTLSLSGAGQSYLWTIMRVQFVDQQARQMLGSPQSVVMQPVESPFYRQFTLDLGCPWPREFDHIRPDSGSVESHGFDGYPSYLGFPSASVLTTNSVPKTVIPGTQDASVTFPFDLFAVTAYQGPGGEADARQAFLLEIGQVLGFGYVVSAADPIARPALEEVRVVPNPANPRAWVHFVLGRQDLVQATVYDLRGRFVTKLADEVLSSGAQRLLWNGDDDRGNPVASGVYVVQIRTNGEQEQRKVALVR